MTAVYGTVKKRRPTAVPSVHTGLTPQPSAIIGYGKVLRNAVTQHPLQQEVGGKSGRREGMEGEESLSDSLILHNHSF